jgi:hypothetical protein
MRWQCDRLTTKPAKVQGNAVALRPAIGMHVVGAPDGRLGPQCPQGGALLDGGEVLDL